MFQNIPFTYHWILIKAIGEGHKTMLDLGCGEGDLMQSIYTRDWDICGLELFDDSLKKAKKTRVYSKLIKGDVTNLPKSLMSKKFDVVFSSQVIEHLPKKKGEKALEEWEKLASKRIVVSTPVGFIKYHRIEGREEDNPLQKHLSGWSVKEMQKRGYTVRGQGARFIYGEGGVAHKFPKLLLPFSVIAYIVSPIVYFSPSLATYMIAWKDK